MLDLVPTRPELRTLVFTRDQWTCQYCGADDADVLEHVIPERAGGVLTLYNLVAACRSCNTSKGSTVRIPTNLDSITADYPEWRERVLLLAADVPERDTNWTNKGVQWRPEHYRALKLLAAALGKEFRVVHETAIAEYIERHKEEIPNG